MHVKTFAKTVLSMLATVAVALFGCGDSGNDNPTGGGGQFTLTTVSNPANGGTVSPVGETKHGAGETVEISATAANGFRFVNWTGAGVTDADSANTNVSMTENRYVIANFEIEVPPCAVGVDCDDDMGYCNNNCALTTRAACGSGTFNATLPAGCQFNPNITYGVFTDFRDGQVYRYVTIGTQTWMAENLNFARPSGSWCYNNETSNCNTYGRLYDWATAMNIDASYNSMLWKGSDIKHRGICPDGWYLPSVDEWDSLIVPVRWFNAEGRDLRAGTGWATYGLPQCEDTYGFSALPGGQRRSDGSFWNVGSWGFWWTATGTTGNNAEGAQGRGMGYGGDITGSALGTGWDKAAGRSVRCIRDDDE